MTSTAQTGPVVIPPLSSGGVMLSYRCSSRCRHCLYRCSPDKPDEWMSLEMAARVFDALSREEHLRSIHLAGGEPGLKLDLLVQIVSMARDRGLPLVYVETNAAWCTDRPKVLTSLKRLKDAGLPALLVSVSMFHNEFVPFKRTRLCVEAAREVFGQGAVIVYQEHIYRALSKMGDDGTRSVEEFCAAAGIGSAMEQLPGMYGLIPGGRVTESLRACYKARPAEAYCRLTCARDLFNTTHFHIDHLGNLFTGLCAGIAPATVDDLHCEITADNGPLFTLLCSAGPCGLMELAARDYGYVPRGEGYISKCDLCLDVRKHLVASGKYSELRPAQFYAP